MDHEKQARVARAHGEASRQSLTLRELPNGYWEIHSLAPPELGRDPLEGMETLLSAERLRLPDGREVGRELTLDQLEGFLKTRP